MSYEKDNTGLSFYDNVYNLGLVGPPQPPTITLHPQNVTVDEGVPWNITSSATGATSSEWYKDGSPTGNTTDTFSGVGLVSESGNYFNRYSNAIGDTDTNNSIVSIAGAGPWALEFVNTEDRYLRIPTWSASGEFEVSGVMDITASGPQGVLYGSLSNFIYLNQDVNIVMAIGGTTHTSSGIAFGTAVPWSISRKGLTVRYNFNGITGSFTASGVFSLNRFGFLGAGGNPTLNGKMYDTIIMNSNSMNNRIYDFNSAVHTGLVVIPDTLDGKDTTSATNFPTDGSCWSQ